MSREGLVLDGLDLNDGTTLTLTGLQFTPAKKMLEWVKGPDSDGSKPLRKPPHDNSEFDLRILIRDTTRDAVMDAAGSIIDKLQEAERQSPTGRGLELVWTPMGSTYTYTFYVLAGESDLDRADDFYKLGKPYFGVKLYTSPFGYGDLETTDAVIQGLPVVTLEIPDVAGDVDAEARVLVADQASQARDDVWVGLEQFGYDADDPQPLLIDSANFVTAGFAGAVTTRTGAYASNGVVRATLGASPVTVCSSGELEHVGSFRNLFRLWPASSELSVRMVWRQGRDQWTAEPWQRAPFYGAFWEPDLGQCKIRQVTNGVQTWQWRLEAKTTNAGDTLDVDYHAMVPTERFARARRVPTFDSSGAYSLRDEFDQSSGNLNGKTLPVGGAWATVGSTTDFHVTGSGTVTRGTDSDASPRYATAGTTNFTAITAQVDLAFPVPAITSSTDAYHGLFVRYTDSANHLRARLTPYGSVILEKVVLSVVTQLAEAAPLSAPQVRVGVTTGGRWNLWVNEVSVGQGSDSALATGGALATGKVGLIQFDTAVSMFVPGSATIVPGML